MPNSKSTLKKYKFHQNLMIVKVFQIFSLFGTLREFGDLSMYDLMSNSNLALQNINYFRISNKGVINTNLKTTFIFTPTFQ